MDQPQALKILQSGANVFLTGSAGTGKTFLLNQFIDYLKKKKIKVGVTASTGLAATHLGGRTIPLRPAWAITVHKSQGMSLDAAEMDLSRCFERGLGYVALSRVWTLKGICLMGINELALEVNEQVAVKDQEFKKLSERAADKKIIKTGN